MPLQAPYSVIGDPKNHDHSMYMSVTGTLGFTDDQLAGKKWYGAVRTSQIAHGKVTSIDASKALAEPGVKGVWWNDLAADGKTEGPNYLAGFSASANITNWGVPVAVVVADDWWTARRASSLIDIKYEALPVVYDPDEAVKPNSPLSGKQATSNETTSTFTRGTAGADFTGAEVTLATEQPWSQTIQHNPIHPRQGLAWFIGDDLYGQCSTQNGMGQRAGLASAIGMQLHKVHAYGHTCGGGHGDGGSNTALNMAGPLSKKLGGHAILVRWSRDNHNTMGSRHYNTKGNLKLGAKKDGTLVACSGDWYGVGGGASGCWYGMRTTYKIPTISWTAHNVYPNVPGRGAWRCISDTPGATIYDAALDKLAAQLDMNPYDLRMKNIMAADAPDQDSPNRVWSGKGVNECFAKAYEASGFATKWHKPGTKTLADGRLHGIAITGHHDSHAGINGTSRFGHIRMGGQDNTGKCFVYVGGAKGSNGPQTQMGHVVAEVLGLKWEDIQIGPWANSDINLDTGNQVGSGHTGACTGYYNAAMEMRKRLFDRAITVAAFKDNRRHQGRRPRRQQQRNLPEERPDQEGHPCRGHQRLAAPDCGFRRLGQLAHPARRRHCQDWRRLQHQRRRGGGLRGRGRPRNRRSGNPEPLERRRHRQDHLQAGRAQGNGLRLRADDELQQLLRRRLRPGHRLHPGHGLQLLQPLDLDGLQPQHLPPD